jgi:hypothetical protein
MEAQFKAMKACPFHPSRDSKWECAKRRGPLWKEEGAGVITLSKQARITSPKRQVRHRSVAAKPDLAQVSGE